MRIWELWTRGLMVPLACALPVRHPLVSVVTSYGLAVAPADRDVLRRTLQACAR